MMKGKVECGYPGFCKKGDDSGLQGPVARCSRDRPPCRALIGRPGAGRLSNGRSPPSI